MMAMVRLLAFAGLALLGAAAIVWLLARLGAGGIPGTVAIRRGGLTVLAPLGLSLLLSLVLTIGLNLIARLLR